MTKKDVDRNRRNSLRLGEFDYSTGRTYFVTLVTEARSKVFYDSQLARATCECLVELRHQLGFRLYCYCLMPDHLHALIGIGESGRTLGQICGTFKSLSTRIYWHRYEGRLWQRQFFDHIIRNDVEHFDTLDYIRLNPVRKGLAKDWRDWRYTGTIDT
jgi:REP element-mobilizing transposase RayT